MICRQKLECNKLRFIAAWPDARWQTECWKSPHDWLVKLDIDLAKFVVGGAQNLNSLF